MFDLIDDYGDVVAYSSYDTATFTNAGLLEKTGGTAVSAIYAAITNTGSIAVASGTLGFYGGGSFGGNISGAGTVAFTGGTSTLSATTTSANLLVNGGTLAIAATETVSGPFSGTSGTITVASAKTLKLTGTASFGTTNAYGPSISGPGTLSTAGAATLATQTEAFVDLYVGGGATWTNSGTATIGGQIDFGLAPADHASFVNQAGGVFDLIDDSADVTAYTSYDTATFTNAGLLEKTGGTAVSAIYATVTNTGSIAVASGTLGFYGGGSFGGNISGAGTVAFTGGTSTLSAATSTAHLLVNGCTLAASTSRSVSGQFFGSSGLVTVAGGATLKLTGTATFGTTNAYGPSISGPGTLATAGASTLATQTEAFVDLYVGGGATWANSSTATIGGQIDFGLAPADTASFVNQAGGVFDLIDNYAGVIAYTSYDTATFSNAGLLEKTGGTGTSLISPVLTNTGTVLVSTGTLSLPVLTNLSGTTVTGGAFEATSGAVLQLANNATIVTDAANIILSGTGSAIQSLNTSTNTQVSIDTTLSTITATGALRLLGGRSFTAVANSGNFSDSGQLQLGGGTLTATSLTVATGATLLGFGTVTGPVASSGLVNANGGLLLLSSALTGNSALEADASATLQLAANTALTIDSTAITLNGAGSEIEWGTTTPTKIESSLTTIGATGKFSVLGNRGYTTTKSITDSGLLQLGGGTFAAASLTVGTGGKLLGSGTVTPAVADAGTIEASGTGDVLKLSAGASGAGTLIADSGATLELAGTTTVGAVTDNGTVKLDGITLTPTSLAVASGAQLTGSGTVTSAVTNSGTIDAIGGTLKLSGAVSGTGALQAAASATLELAAATAAGVVTDSGTVKLDGVTVTPTSLTVVSGAQLTGFGTVASAVTNGGTISASGGTLKVSGAVTGTGSLLINAGQTLELGSSAASTQTAVFASSTGTLSLDAPGSFAGSISSFTGSDEIYLGGQVATSLSYNTSTHVLTVSGSSGTIASLTFNGNYVQSNFVLTNGGEDITDPKAPVTPETISVARAPTFIKPAEGNDLIAVPPTNGNLDMRDGFSLASNGMPDLHAALNGTAWSSDGSQVGDFVTAQHSGGDTGLFGYPAGLVTHVVDFGADL